MRTIRTILAAALLTTCALNASGQQTPDDTLKYEILLTPSMADELNPSGRFINSLSLTSKQHLLLSTRDQFYLLGWGGITPVGKKISGSIGSFAYTPDNLLMTIRNNELCVFDSLGNLRRLYTLPDADMGISQGKYVMYIFDRTGTKEKQSLYVIAHGAKYSKLFDVPKPIYSVVESGKMILFTNGNSVFSYNPDNKEIKAVVSLPDDKTIRSLTADPTDGRIFFSTDNMVFSLKGNEQSVITDKIGGKLMFYDGLIIFNPENRILMRITGLDGSFGPQKAATGPLPPASPPTADALTNATIISLVRDKLSDGVIISIINRSKVNFNLSVDSMVELSENNVSSDVIMAMKEAMKKQSAMTQQK